MISFCFLTLDSQTDALGSDCLDWAALEKKSIPTFPLLTGVLSFLEQLWGLPGSELYVNQSTGSGLEDLPINWIR